MKKLKQVLHELKQKYGIIGIRTDMASEVISEQEFIIFKQFCGELGLKYFIKIGGCDALTDIFVAQKAGADSIICPMIESEYAVQKFLDNCMQIYGSTEHINLLINIETINAYNNLDLILKNENMKYIQGIVLGRDDMTKSASLSFDDVDSKEILDIALNIANKADSYGQKFTVGGGVRPRAKAFLSNFKGLKFVNFETRRVVFDSGALNDTDIVEGIAKAIEFEIKWLEYMAANCLSDKDIIKNRMESLKSCIQLK